MGTSREFESLPPRVDPDLLVQEVPPVEAVSELHGVRRVSPYSPIAGIDEARLYAAIATDPRAGGRRRRLARAVAIAALAGAVVGAVVPRLL